ncbi:MAG TPA: hypothetical protein VFF11_03865, partial [Candidatus Binatia bacterium]|nr:hypothetical protein [Candidatus Binatia bacterium]
MSEKSGATNHPLMIGESEDEREDDNEQDACAPNFQAASKKLQEPHHAKKAAPERVPLFHPL